MQEIETLTLGGLIAYVTELDGEELVPLEPHLHSYRGYYQHVALPKGWSTADQLLVHLANKLGTTMRGYKGGEFPITESCQVFVADYGHTGDLLALNKSTNKLGTVEEPWLM